MIATEAMTIEDKNMTAMFRRFSPPRFLCPMGLRCLLVSYYILRVDLYLWTNGVERRQFRQLSLRWARKVVVVYLYKTRLVWYPPVIWTEFFKAFLSRMILHNIKEKLKDHYFLLEKGFRTI